MIILGKRLSVKDLKAAREGRLFEYQFVCDFWDGLYQEKLSVLAESYDEACEWVKKKADQECIVPSEKLSIVSFRCTKVDLNFVLKQQLKQQEVKEVADLEIVLDVERPLSGGGPDTMFYRYLIGDFELRFTQDMKNGNLLNVKLEERGDELEDFRISVKDTQLQFGVFYPTRFEIEPLSYPRGVEEVKEHLEKWQKAIKVLSAVEEFFVTSKHFELFSKHHCLERSVDDILSSANMRVCDEDVSERKDRSLVERCI